MNEEVAVIVGVGGMGMAIARRVGSGRRLVLADYADTALQHATDLLRGEGYAVTSVKVDVSDRQSVADLADGAAQMGLVTCVAHTAGVSPAQASAEQILRVDLLGVAVALEEFGRVVARGGAGVFIASMAGHLSTDLSAEQLSSLASVPSGELLGLQFLNPAVLADPGVAYSVAKRANIVRVQAASSSWGSRGARVNSISPGVISTPMGQHELASGSGRQMQQMIDVSAAGRIGTPDDIAAAAAFLLDRQSGFITGTDLLVDGGVVAAVRMR